MNDEELLATQGGTGDGAAGDGSEGAGGGNASAQNDQPFLKINDRQVYRTREEAAKAFDEAGRRIATLSPYEKALREYYGDRHSPEALRAHLAELVKFREEKTARETAEAAKKAAGDDPEFQGKTPEQIEALKQAREWFKAQAEKLGYVSKDALSKLQAKIDAIEQGGTKATETAQAGLVAHGQQELAAQLKASNVTLDEAQYGKLEKRIVAYINGDDELVARWQEAVASRNKTEAVALVMEAAKFALPGVKPGAKFVDPVSARIAAGRDKQQLQNGVPRKLPQAGAAAGVADGKKVKYTGLGDKRLTDAALAKMDELMGAATD